MTFTSNLSSGSTPNLASGLTPSQGLVLPVINSSLKYDYMPFADGFLKNQLVTVDGSVVENYIGQNGTDRDAIQADPDHSPAYVEEAILGLPALDFDGNDQLNVAPFAFDPAEMTIFVVLTTSTIANGQGTIIGNVNGSGGGFMLLRLDNSYVMFYGGAEFPQSISGAFTADVPQILAVTSDSSVGVSFYRNGSLFDQVNGALTTNPAVDGLSIGNSSASTAPGGGIHWDGFIGEVIVYDSVLSSPEITSVNQYLSQKTKIALA